MTRRRKLPKYRRHKPSGQAVVTLSGKDFYLGSYDSAVSRVEYDRLVAEWLVSGRTLPPDPEEESGLTVDEVSDDVGNLCAPGYMCIDGSCQEVEPQELPGDEPPAADDGSPAGGCGCASTSSGDFGGGAVLFFLCALVLVRRRR